jgi:hypothetical protein
VITFDELRAISELKTHCKDARDAAITAKKNSYLVVVFPAIGQLYDSVIKLTKAVDWFIELIERETEIPCNEVDIEIAEYLERVKRGQLKRNAG